MDVTLFTNAVAGAWSPADLDKFLGGNEESIVLWAREVARHGHAITVYASVPAELRDGPVTYRPRAAFDYAATYDVLVSFKDLAPWVRGARARARVHWSNDVEPPPQAGVLRQVQRVVTLGSYHRERLAWLPAELNETIPLGTDFEVFGRGGARGWLARGRPPAKDPLVIYTSSPDRGLATLVEDLPLIRRHLPRHRFAATYRWGPGTKGLAAAAAAAGVTLLTPDRAGMAELYRRAEYWVHPLNRPDSDLAGFSALQARLAGCRLVVPTVAVSGFRDAVATYVPYRAFLRGDLDAVENPAVNPDLPLAWSKLVAERWLPLLKDLRSASVGEAA